MVVAVVRLGWLTSRVKENLYFSGLRPDPQLVAKVIFVFLVGIPRISFVLFFIGSFQGGEITLVMKSDRLPPILGLPLEQTCGYGCFVHFCIPRA
jgi:hypothetical protein